MNHQNTLRLLRQKDVAARFAPLVPTRESFNPSPARGNFAHEDHDYMTALGAFVDEYRKQIGAVK